MRRGFAAILLVGLVAIAILGTTIYLKQNKTLPMFNQSATQSAPQQTPASIPDETANPDLIGANWKTFENKEYKFSLKYPSNILVDARDMQCDKSYLLPLQMYDKTEKIAWNGETYNIDPQQTCNTVPISLRIQPGDFEVPKPDVYRRITIEKILLSGMSLQKYIQTQTHLRDGFRN